MSNRPQLARHRIRLRRLRLPMALGAVVTFVATVLGIVTAGTATAGAVYGNWSISAPYAGQMNDSQGGWFDGLVYFDSSSATKPYNWVRFSSPYVGPGNATYYQWKDVDSGRCLSHTGEYLVAEPCVWADNSQWWAVTTVQTGTNPVPPGGLPWPILKNLMMPWDAPTSVITQQDGLALLKPKLGTIGSTAQHLDVRQMIIPA